MKKLVLISLFLLLNFQMFPQINQGDVLINSFDPAIEKNYLKEMVVLVNNTSSTIDLNGYELICFKFDGTTKQAPFWQFTSTTLLPPYGFLLITNNTDSVSGIRADLVKSAPRGFIDFDGYLIFSKISVTDSSDFIDIVKYQSFQLDRYPFTGVPPNSGISLSMPWFVLDDSPGTDEYATRGGVDGDINSLNYTNYGMMGQSVSDFIKVFETDTLYIENSSSSPLPVELSSFSAVVLSEKEVMLKWRTETEVRNYGFEIQRKTYSDIEWTRIGFVAGNGNSNIPKNYSFTDGNPANGSKFKYRLKQIDTDGKYEYSNEIEVEIVPDILVLYQNYPNPFNPTTKIRYQLPKESKVTIKIYDILGVEVMTLLNEKKEPGIYEVELNATSLSSGTYIYRIVTTNPLAGSEQGFVETKKMILLR